ncbi:ABC transporter permease [Dyella caseinilytica]|uniref:ABC transporter permease n=1 Tax=Dyella caseinilytica TaxID=1849581 RepID=A0ABX7GR40_9GAMM|nr:FtsX-like permease family protein [Dyella caseinilytica]QRN52769.1 ABC transporter permease [Dyella caseinilytica]GGA08588.1 ABC transporter permease [Dyella caseinilytica]
MDIRPILFALRRHKLTCCLLVLQIAFTCAIVCNTIFLIGQRLERINLPSGIAENELVYIQLANIGGRPDGKARAAEDMAALRQIPGVTAVALPGEMPFDNGSNNMDIRINPEQHLATLSASQYFGEGVVKTFGVQLVEGRDLRPEEYVDLSDVFVMLANKQYDKLPNSTLITRAMAERMWPGKDPLGKQFYVGAGMPFTVVGVMANLIRPGSNQMNAGAGYSTVWPVRLTLDQGVGYMIRCAPQDRDQVLKSAVEKLKTLDPNRIVLDKGTMEQHRRDFFRNDRAMVGILLGVCIALLVVTALGIVGLASFWVAQRNRSIGVRRALGATRGNILHYFQTENFLLTTMGIALGMVLAYGINLFLIVHYELPRMPAMYFPVGALILWGIGQVAVLGPALRAAAVPPVVATRSV